LSVKQFLAKNQHPSPYSPDLAQREFWTFSKLKSALKATHFESVVSTNGKRSDALNANGKNVKLLKTVNEKSLD